MTTNLDHLHIVRSGETKLVFELTFSSDADATRAFEAVKLHFRDGPCKATLCLNPAPAAVSWERKKT